MSSNSASASRDSLTVEQLADGVRGGDRAVLARTITLIESEHREDAAKAQAILARLMPFTGSSIRVGISGVPGVGKSTFIDALGTRLIREHGHRVAVLAVDPSSVVSGGSILGDKSRMPNLANEPQAFIRPSPNALTPGGVGRRTRETLLVCEAAGYDVVLVETVGVGQSEVLVAEMVDFFMVLLLAGAGDELQGIKKGIVELADLLAINKADGENQERAARAQSEYEAALRYLPARSTDWRPPVLAVSGLTGEGLERLWEQVLEHRRILSESGELEGRRREQGRQWMWSLIRERLDQGFRNHPEVARHLLTLEGQVLAGRVSARQAADELLEIFLGSDKAD